MKSRRELIEEIVNEIWKYSWIYEEFVQDCIRKEIEKWRDEDLKAFLYGEEDEEE